MLAASLHKGEPKMLRGLVALTLGLLAQVWSASAQDQWVLLASHDIELSAGETSIDLDAAQPIKQLRLVANKRVASRCPRSS